jgi:hypothetical protein
MFRWALRRAIDKVEREWNRDATHRRDMMDASPRAAWLASRVTYLLATAALVIEGSALPHRRSHKARTDSERATRAARLRTAGATARSRRSLSGGGSAAAKRRARARVGESEGRSPRMRLALFSLGVRANDTLATTVYRWIR